MASNEPPSLLSPIVGVKHVEGVHLWHLLIDKLQVEDVVTVSQQARAVALRATCCTEVVTPYTSEDVKAIGD